MINIVSFRGDPPEPPVIPVVIMNKQQKTSSSPPSDQAPRTADRIPAEGSITTASGTAAPDSNSGQETEDVELEGRFGLWKSFDKLSPKILRRRLNYKRARSSSSSVAVINVGIARNFSL